MALTVRPELINAAGLLSGPVAFAMVDYSMGSALWVKRESGERIATINISINYMRTAREGEVYCESVLDRRNDRSAVLRSAVTGAPPPPRPVAGHGDRELLDLPGRAPRPARPRPRGARDRGRIGWRE